MKTLPDQDGTPVSPLLLRLLWAAALLLPAFGAQAAVVLTTLYAFRGVTNASYDAVTQVDPSGLVQGSDGYFYGTTSFGGDKNLIDGYGCGTVFKISANGMLTTLYAFGAVTNASGDVLDGVQPNGLVQGSDGDFYGTTSFGGTNGLGTVFKISTNGVLTTLYSFAGVDDGSYAIGALVQGNDGNFYGTTDGDGTNYDGTVFTISTNGALTTLYSFSGGTNGGNPFGQLVHGSDGYFYGTTASFGIDSDTVFKISANGVLTTLYSFGSLQGPSGLVQGSDGYFYGTTSDSPLGSQGATGNGTVFQISTNGALTTLYSFAGGDDGANPLAWLMQSSDGYFYGTTRTGGTSNNGTLFQISTNWVLTTLYSFGNADGLVQGLVQGRDGSFYGTTSTGGQGGYGTVIRLTIVPEFQSVTLTNNSISLTWSTEHGAVYQLQYSAYNSDLGSSNWVNFGNAVTAAGTALTAVDYNVTILGGPRRYYRVVLSP